MPSRAALLGAAIGCADRFHYRGVVHFTVRRGHADIFRHRTVRFIERRINRFGGGAALGAGYRNVLGKGAVFLIHRDGRRMRAGVAVGAGKAAAAGETVRRFYFHRFTRIRFAVEGGAGNGAGMRTGRRIVDHRAIARCDLACCIRFLGGAGETIGGGVLLGVARERALVGDAGFIHAKALTMRHTLGVRAAGAQGQCDGDCNQ